MLSDPATLTATRQRSAVSRLFEVHEGLISRTSVLWLSGVLIGMAISGGLAGAADLYCFEFGVFGLIAYITFEVAAQRRLHVQWDQETSRLTLRNSEPGYALPRSHHAARH